MNKKSSNKAFAILADTKFDAKLLVETFSLKKTTRGQEKVMRLAYNGCSTFSFECNVTGTRQYKDKMKDLVVCAKLPSPSPYDDLPQNQGMAAARKFFQEMSDELEGRYLRDKWYAGSGPGGEGGIQPHSVIVTDENGNETVRKYMPEERFRPLAKVDAFGMSLDLTIYNYLEPKLTDFPPPVVYLNARTMTKISPADVQVATYPAYGFTEGTTVQVRPLMSTTWHALENPNVILPTPAEDLKKCFIKQCRARVEVGTFSSCNPKSKLSQYAWSIKMTLSAIELFVPQRRTHYLPPGPTRDLFTHTREEPAFLENASPGWVRVFCEEAEKYRLKMANQNGEPDEPVEITDDNEHRDKKQKVSD